MKAYINILLFLVVVGGLFAFVVPDTFAHQSGCHRWHSCPSDSGSYTCGDAGYPCKYPTYPASGGVIYPPSGYYKDCYDCAWKKVPTNDSRLWKSNLQRGNSGLEVTRLQKALKSLGFFQGDTTGYYGSITENAVKKFQANYDIATFGTPATTGYGRVGWTTMSKLNDLYTSESDFSNSYQYATPTVNCPNNSHQSLSDPTKCACDVGFEPDVTLTSCVSNETERNHQSCRDSFGTHSYWDGTKAPSGSLYCGCQAGYVWNSSNTSCVLYTYTPPSIDNKTIGENYYKTNDTCIGLSNDQYSYCISYALNH